jgi:hypothetical protein
MNWEAIGAVGEIVGAAAVVITLVYLAVQLKQNTAAMRSSTFQGISSTLAKNMEVLTTTPGLPALLLKAGDGLEALSAEERVQFSGFCLMVHRRIESIFVQKSLGALDPSLAEGFERSILLAYANRGYREWWNISRSSFSDVFVAWIDSKLEQINSDKDAGEVPNLGITGRKQ